MLVFTAVATPFVQNKVDLVSFARLVKAQKEAKIDGLVCASTTGEGMSLSACEKKLLVSVAKSCCDIPIWLGVSAGCAEELSAKVAWAEKVGADGILLAPPAFCKCTAKGFVEMVRLAVRQCNLPMMLYNAPSRVGYQLEVESVKQLAQEGICAIKDADEGLVNSKRYGRHMEVFCGCDDRLAEFGKMGAKGVVSVVSNVAPRLTKEILTVFNKSSGFSKSAVDKILRGANTNGQMATLAQKWQKFEALARLSALEINPIAIKYMLYKEGIFHSYQMRLPLTEASFATKRAVNEVWKRV